MRYNFVVNNFNLGAIGAGNKINGNDYTITACGNTNYCPGDGVAYPEYSGVQISNDEIVAKAAGAECSGNVYSNGGITWYSCTLGSPTDKSNCDNDSTQFSPGFFNTEDQRENDVVSCLDNSGEGGTASTDTGDSGKTCGIEGSNEKALAEWGK